MHVAPQLGGDVDGIRVRQSAAAESRQSRDDCGSIVEESRASAIECGGGKGAARQVIHGARVLAKPILRIEKDDVLAPRRACESRASRAQR
eukprot:6191088-Pleurochrysis_carterae.AAC.2